MANLKWHLLPKETKLQIRTAMLEEMIRTLSDEEPDADAAVIRKKASQMVNLAISREQAKQRAAMAVLN